MQEHPFSDDDWQTVVEACRLVTNACLADDSVLHASKFVDLVEVLSELRRKYGDHPAIDEVQADFTEDPQEQISLYERALMLAMENGLATLSIRMAMASTFLEVGDAGRAAAEPVVWSCSQRATKTSAGNGRSFGTSAASNPLDRNGLENETGNQMRQVQ